MPARFVIKAPKRLTKLFDQRRWNKNLRRNMRQATKLNGLAGAKAQRDTIKDSQGLAKNADLTQAIKGSEKPLVDHADLFAGITSKVVSDFEAFSGVLRTDGNFNIAVGLHGGTSVNVTEKMRTMFFYLWLASMGKVSPSKLTGRAAELFERNQDWMPLSEATTVILTPERPWVKLSFDAGLRRVAERNWTAALAASAKDQVRV